MTEKEDRDMEESVDIAVFKEPDCLSLEGTLYKALVCQAEHDAACNGTCTDKCRSPEYVVVTEEKSCVLVWHLPAEGPERAFYKYEENEAIEYAVQIVLSRRAEVEEQR